MIEIPLTQGKVALVDDCDAHLAAHRWHAHKDRHTYYARRSVFVDGKWRTVYLHQAVLGAAVGPKIDHKNRDGLDCRRENLRPATETQNSANRRPGRRSGLKGVYRCSRVARPWRSDIMVGGRTIHLGNFATAEEAARAYDAAAVKYFGEFALTNAELVKAAAAARERAGEGK